MKKSFSQIKWHIYLTIITLIIFAIISIVTQSMYEKKIIFDLFDMLFFILMWILFFGIFAIPLLIAIYLTYLYLSKNKLLRIIQIIIIPLIGAGLIPFYYHYKSVSENDNWAGIAAGLFGLCGLILYLVNEIYFFIRFKKLK